eukprot:Platyproteum_vivax@DN4215_c0_g1_i1.p1
MDIGPGFVKSASFGQYVSSKELSSSLQHEREKRHHAVKQRERVLKENWLMKSQLEELEDKDETYATNRSHERDNSREMSYRDSSPMQSRDKWSSRGSSVGTPPPSKNSRPSLMRRPQFLDSSGLLAALETDTLKDEVASLHLKLEELLDHESKLQTKVVTLQQEADLKRDLEDKVLDLELKVFSLEESERSAQESLRSKDEIIESSSRTINKMKEELTRQQDEATDKQDVLSTSLQEAQQRLTVLHQKVDSTLTSKKTIEDKMAQVEEMNSQLRQNVEELQDVLNTERSKGDEMKSIVEDIEEAALASSADLFVDLVTCSSSMERRTMIEQAKIAPQDIHWNPKPRNSILAAVNDSDTDSSSSYASSRKNIANLIKDDLPDISELDAESQRALGHADLEDADPVGAGLEGADLETGGEFLSNFKDHENNTSQSTRPGFNSSTDSLEEGGSDVEHSKGRLVRQDSGKPPKYQPSFWDDVKNIFKCLGRPHPALKETDLENRPKKRQNKRRPTESRRLETGDGRRGTRETGLAAMGRERDSPSSHSSFQFSSNSSSNRYNGHSSGNSSGNRCERSDDRPIAIKKKEKIIEKSEEKNVKSERLKGGRGVRFSDSFADSEKSENERLNDVSMYAKHMHEKEKRKKGSSKEKEKDKE